jgi:hypothetical protein
VAGIGCADALLAGELAAAIGVKRHGGVGFHIGRALAPVEHIVGRHVNKGNAAAACRHSETAGGFGIDSEGERLVALGAIDIGVAGGVDDCAPRLCRDQLLERGGVAQVDGGSRRRRELDGRRPGKRA